MARRAWQYAIGPGGALAAYDIYKSQNRSKAYGNILKSNVKLAALTSFFLQSGGGGKIPLVRAGFKKVNLESKVDPIPNIVAGLIPLLESEHSYSIPFIDEVLSHVGAIPYLI